MFQAARHTLRRAATRAAFANAPAFPRAALAAGDAAVIAVYAMYAMNTEPAKFPAYASAHDRAT